MSLLTIKRVEFGPMEAWTLIEIVARSTTREQNLMATKTRRKNERGKPGPFGTCNGVDPVFEAFYIQEMATR